MFNTEIIPVLKLLRESIIRTTSFVLILRTEKKFLRKLVVWITQKHVKNQIYPQKLLTKMLTFFSEVFHLSFNATVNKGTLPYVFKLADVNLIFKKCSKNSKDNYRQISILKNLSKVFQAWINCVPVANRARSGALISWDTPDFLGVHILPCKILLDLQVFSQISKTWKSYSKFQILSWTPAYLWYFHKVYISHCVKTALCTRGLWNI